MDGELEGFRYQGRLSLALGFGTISPERHRIMIAWAKKICVRPHIRDTEKVDMLYLTCFPDQPEKIRQKDQTATAIYMACCDLIVQMLQTKGETWDCQREPSK